MFSSAESEGEPVPEAVLRVPSCVLLTFPSVLSFVLDPDLSCETQSIQSQKMEFKVWSAIIVLVAFCSTVHAASHGVDLSTLASEYVPTLSKIATY